MTYAEDPDGYRQRLEAKLDPGRIRSTLAFAGLFQITHEMLKRTVLDDAKGFFGWSDVFDGGTWIHGPTGENDYRTSVLALDPKRPFRASLLWLKSMDVIDDARVARLDDICAHRHDLTHELMKYVVDQTSSLTWTSFSMRTPSFELSQGSGFRSSTRSAGSRITPTSTLMRSGRCPW